MTKAEKTRSFDPNNPGDPDAQIYGLPFTCEEADIVIVPVPWEVTTSYGGGTSRGPQAVFDASFQVDLFNPEFPDLWKRGVAMDEMPAALLEQSHALKKKAAKVMDAITGDPGKKEQREASKALELINAECAVMNEWVEARCGEWMDQGKLVGLLGGDHSTPLGLFKAQAARHKEFGILHIDAHLDLRIAYEGFSFSHASIMHNALSIPQLKRIVSVGIRDFCSQENEVFMKAKDRVAIVRSADLRTMQYEGTTWKQQCERIIDALPQKVHISFDIDGLDPTLCPNTGTPVPGGLQFEEATYLLSMLARKRTIIGFDLVEVSPGADEWDANVGARMLWHLCGVLAGK
ncbi:MAG TPA: agmatinase family protein [Flavobacteriales bacterium]|nr:agmatinase family protein [Flavobacteriales bacterium]